MSIHWTARVDGELLLVQVSGEDDGLSDVLAYGRGVIAAAVQAGIRRVLCDERALRYRIGVVDTWTAATALVDAVPASARIALVYAPESAEAARFWEDTAWTRGVQCRVFVDVEAARRWLLAN